MKPELSVDLFEDFESHVFDFQSLPQDLMVRFGGTADAFICMTSLRYPRMIYWTSDAGMSDSFIIQHQILLCHYYDVVLLVEVLLLLSKSINVCPVAD